MSPTYQVNIPASPERFRTDPDLYLFHIRMSVAITPGYQAVIQVVFAKTSI